MNFAEYIGQTLDGKYRVESELGRGGMGTVYLATHVGTERHVAVKIIAPQFMERDEFVERFRREARAAGRLRHPNVVNVTDFGFAQTNKGRVAYLVMEYLDGCTLGEILEEEQHLPLDWTLDIIEQVCAAVHAAHEQGIIHRDLKPDNIWLEPNQRGSYTVKVLDFGIAKLEEQISGESADAINISYAPPMKGESRQTVAIPPLMTTAAEQRSDTQFSEGATLAVSQEKGTLISEKGTLIQMVENPAEEFSEKGTLIQPVNQTSEDSTAIFQNTAETGKILSQSGDKKSSTGNNSAIKHDTPVSKDLTSVGAVLGTPLFMSPEQCRGEKLMASSDIYSLGIIAYRMLSGKQPFDGDYLKVMEAHKDSAPPPITRKKIPRKVKKVIFASLAKNPYDRPPTAESFAAEMRAQSEGIGTLLRRALELYSRYLPKFLLLALVTYIPMIILTVAVVSVSFLDLDKSDFAKLKTLLTLLLFFVTLTCGSVVVGANCWLVAQTLAFPLKPVRIRPALEAVRRRWKKLIWTSILQSVLIVVGYAFCLIPGVILTVIWGLASAVVMMEGKSGFAALRRSKELVKRSLRTTIATTLIMFFVPLATSLSLAYFAHLAVQDISRKAQTATEIKDAIKVDTSESTPEKAAEKAAEKETSIVITPDQTIHITRPGEREGSEGKLKAAFSEALQTIIYLPISIILISFFTIISALLYFKTRQVGGETMDNLLDEFEDNDRPGSQWQQRVRQRSLVSGRTASKS